MVLMVILRHLQNLKLYCINDVKNSLRIYYSSGVASNFEVNDNGNVVINWNRY